MIHLHRFSLICAFFVYGWCVVGALVWPQVEESCGWGMTVTSWTGAGTLLCAYVCVCARVFVLTSDFNGIAYEIN